MQIIDIGTVKKKSKKEERGGQGKPVIFRCICAFAIVVFRDLFHDDFSNPFVCKSLVSFFF